MDKTIKTEIERRNAGQEAYGSSPAEGQELQGDELPEAGLREGIAVEAEHAGLVAWLKQTMADTGAFPADEEIFAKIAEAHLEEKPDYYKELAKMEKKNTERAHTPITSQQQADFFGAELGRKKKGEKGETDMSIDELERHLKEWGGRSNAQPSTTEDRRNEGARAYGSEKINSKRISTGNAQAKYGITGKAGETFDVPSGDKMLEPGKYKVIGDKIMDERSGIWGDYSSIEVEKIG